MSGQSFDYWQLFIEETKRMKAPLYTHIVEGVAYDDDLKALATTARRGQPPANILLAAVHYLLLRGAEHGLRTYYPNLNDGDHRDPADVFPVFKNFVGTHRDALEPLIAGRVTNTNEVGRSAFLHAGFRALAADAGAPLHLVEIGPSAGLNQAWDKYTVRYAANDGVHTIGPHDGALVIDAEARGEKLPPLGPSPTIASRVGLELNPVDLSDADQRDWLRALVWPDALKRFAQLERAIEIAARFRPNIVAGDALENLPDVLGGLPANETVCVYHTFVTYQFTQAGRQALDDMLVGMSVRRPLWRLSIEGTLAPVDAPMLLYSYKDGLREKRHLAGCSPHGSWIEWLA